MNYSNEVNKTSEQTNSIYSNYYLKNVDIQSLIDKQYVKEEEQASQMNIEVNSEPKILKPDTEPKTTDESLELPIEVETNDEKNEEFEIESIINLISSDENFFSNDLKIK